VGRRFFNKFRRSDDTEGDGANMAAEAEKHESPFDMREALRRSLSRKEGDLDPFLVKLERDVAVDGAKARLHAYFLPIDANGRYRVEALAEYLRDRVVDYAIPRRRIEEAEREQRETGSTAPILRLERQARGLFSRIATSGEGGELLLFAMAESMFELSQILCKMSLKTAGGVHYHGADGVYAEAREDGGLNVYWGESKVHGRVTDAIRDCLASLKAFLTEPDSDEAKRSRDVLLVNDFGNFTDERLVAGLRTALDVRKVASLGTRHCGIALVAFDCGGYQCSAEPSLEAIEDAIRNELPKWSAQVANRLGKEGLARVEIHFICVPMPAAEQFRDHFLQLLGGTG
jgi:hypothetical protein